MRKKFFIFFIVLLLFNFILPVKSVKAINLDSYNLAVEELSQINIREIADRGYVTIIDNDKNIISSNYPDLEVNPKILNEDDTIIVLIEFPYIKDYIDGGVKNDTYYYLDLPHEIIPIEDDLVTEEPDELISSSLISAVGGIYKYGDKYRFKVKFSDCEDQTDIELQYQFKAKINEDYLVKIGDNDLSLDFDVVGTADIVVNKKDGSETTPGTGDDEEEKKSDFELNVAGLWEKQNSKTSNVDIDNNWTVVLKDNRDNKILTSNNILKINLPNNNQVLPFSMSKGELPIAVYLDDEKIACQYETPYSFSCSSSDKKKAIRGDYSQNVLIPNLQIFGYSNGLTITFNPESNFTGEVNEWKFVFNGQRYTNDSLYELDAKFVNDGEEISALDKISISNSTTLSQKVSYDDRFYYDEMSTNIESLGTIPNLLYYKARISDSVYNLVGYKILSNKKLDNEILNLFYFYNAYYTESLDIKDSIGQVYINDKEVSFEYVNALSKTSYHQIFSQSNGEKYDGIAMLQIKKLMEENDELSGALLFKSTEKYSGKYYYMIVSPNATGIPFIFDEISRTNIDAKVFEIYFVNVAGDDIEFKYKEGLAKIEETALQANNFNNEFIPNRSTNNSIIKSDIELYTEEGKINSSHGTVSTDFKLNTSYAFFNDMSAKYITNSIIEWNLELDYNKYKPKDKLSELYKNEKKLFSSLLNVMYINIQLNNNQEIPIYNSEFNSSTIPELKNIPTISYMHIYDYTTNSYAPIGNFENGLLSDSTLSKLQNYSYINKTFGGFAKKHFSLNNNSLEPIKYRYYTRSEGHDNSTYLSNTAEIITIGTQDGMENYYSEISPAYINLDVKSTAIAPTPKLKKSQSKTDKKSYVDSNGDLVIAHKYNLEVDLTSNGIKYNGHIDISDNLKNSEVYIVEKNDSPNLDESFKFENETRLESGEDYSSLSRNELIEKEPEQKKSENLIETTYNSLVAKHSKLTNISLTLKESNETINVQFTEDEINNKQLVKYLDSNGNSITETQYYNLKNPIKVTLKYEGNLENDFNIAVDGIEEGVSATITYDTVFNQAAFSKELIVNKLPVDSTFRIKFSNKAFLPTTSIESNSVEDLSDITLFLSTDKYISDEVDLFENNYIKKYTVKALTGYSEVPSIDITDSVRRYLEIDKNAKVLFQYIDNSDSIKALAESFELFDMIITLNNGDGEEKIVYEEGSFKEQYNNSTLTYSEDHNNGLLYTLHLESNSGISPGTEITITYAAKLNIDKKLSNSGVTFRSSNHYASPYERLYIDTLVRSEVNTNIEDAENKASNRVVDNVVMSGATSDGKLFASGGAAGTYLSFPRVTKTILRQNGTTTDWKVTYNSGTIGKDVLLNSSLLDTPLIIVENDISSESKQKILNLIKKYQQFKDVALDYESGFSLSIDGNHNVTKDLSFERVIYHPGILEGSVTGTSKQNNEDATFKLLVDDDKNLRLTFENVTIGKTIESYYTTDLDFKKFQKEAIEQNILTTDYMLVQDITSPLVLKIFNAVDTILYRQEAWGTDTIITENAKVVKNVTENNKENNTTSWEVVASTGTLCMDELEIVDDLEVISESKDIIEKSLILENLVIKLDDEVVYNNGVYADGYDISNLMIKIDGVHFEIKIKNIDDNIILGNNQAIVITYDTKLDLDKYSELGGKNIENYILENVVKLNGDTIISSNTARSEEYVIEAPAEITKEYLGAVDGDISRAQFKIESTTGIMDRYDYKISDIITSDYKKYLSIENIQIIIDDEEYYNSNNLKPNNLNIYKSGTEEMFELNVIGSTDFDILFNKLEKNKTIKVYYIIKIDRNSYLNEENNFNTNLEINNEATLTSRDGLNEKSDGNGVVRVDSTLTKVGTKAGYSINELPLIKWSIGINLLTEYTLEELEGKEVYITDKLNSYLKYYSDSLHIYNVISTEDADIRDTELSSDEYELEVIDNTIIVKILNPSVNYNLEIVFDTEAITSLNKTENSVTLSIKDITTDEEPKVVEQVESENVNGVVSSNKSGLVRAAMTNTINIKAKKYLDDKESNIPFTFELIEVTSDGIKVENGYSSRTQNDKVGDIIFDSIRFNKVGTYYYKIKEIKTNKKYKFDDTEYMIKIIVTKNMNDYEIDYEIMSSNDKDEIVFNNYTIKEEKNPQTGDNILIYIGIFMISFFGIVISKKILKIK